MQFVALSAFQFAADDADKADHHGFSRKMIRPFLRIRENPLHPYYQRRIPIHNAMIFDFDGAKVHNSLWQSQHPLKSRKTETPKTTKPKSQ